MMIQPNQGTGDDSSANKLDLFCESGQKLSAPTETSFGDWVPHLRCPHGQAVIGLQVRVETKQGSGDDTALNGVRMICSSYTQGLSEILPDNLTYIVTFTLNIALLFR